MNLAVDLASLASAGRRFLRLCLPMLAGVTALEGAAPSTAKAESMSEKYSSADLLPLAWQKNPRLHLMVNTEFTEAGKKLPEVTPGRPAYFELHTRGYREIGHTPVGEKTLKAEQLEPTLLKALAGGGYYPAKPGQTPSLLIAYRWGAHSQLWTSNRNAVIRNELDRAEMIGGVKFAQELDIAYRERSILAQSSATLSPEVRAFLDPVNLLKKQDPKMEVMIDRVTDDIYYILASAYDYASMMEGRPVILWRTRVTVASNGVTQADTLPTMLVTAGPFFGKETNGVELISRRTVPEGSVELGTATVVEADVPASSAPVETKK